MWSLRASLLVVLAFLASAQALVLQPAGHLGLHHAASAATRADACPCMGCRTNLKKEKRLRNRINAFRFKKGGFKKPRFPRPDYAADQRKADEDSQYATLVFSYSAEEAANA